MHSSSILLGATTLLTLTAALPSSRAGYSPPSVVDLGYARYQGASNDTLGITRYYNLQYAAPPTGAQRWRPPIPIENSTVFRNSSSQIINATVPGIQCPQTFPAWSAGFSQFGGGLPATDQVQSEDCLRLDVIVPNAPVSSSLPVLVQIHGGGYTIGNSLTYDGSYMTSFSNGSIIYVQIQYRLGFLGFLNGAAVMADGTANAGLLDQRAALEWVQRNIAKFGGDPKKVTIWGGSAGGGSITAQMQLYGGEANPPFRAGIAEYPWWQPFHAKKILDAQYNELLQASNCSDLNCLRALPGDVLVNATQQVFISGYAAGNYGYGDFYAGPAVDGTIIKELPSIAFAAGRYSKIPLITDREGYEGVIFTNTSLSAESQVLPTLSTVWQTNSTAFFARLFQLYPLSDFGSSYFSSNPFTTALSKIVPKVANNSVYWQTQQIFGDFIINCPTYYIASALTNAGQPVYKLVFETGSQVHGATIPFLTGANNQPGIDPKVAAQMKAYWIGFIVNLDPNSSVGNGSDGPSRPEWPLYLIQGQDQLSVLRFNTTAAGVISDPDASGRCDFFHGQGYIVRN